MTVYSPIDEAIASLRRSDAERPTLLELPEQASESKRSQAYADLAFASSDRMRRTAHVLELINSESKEHADYVEKRLDRIEEQVGTRLGRIEEQMAQLVTLIEGALRKREGEP